MMKAAASWDFKRQATQLTCEQTWEISSGDRGLVTHVSVAKGNLSITSMLCSVYELSVVTEHWDIVNLLTRKNI